jgi:hypothetical protein
MDQVQVEFDLWSAAGRAEKIPTQKVPYRYPATISVITQPANLLVELIDHTGQAWPATDSAAGIHTFVIGPRWPSGDYALRLSLSQQEQMAGQVTTEPLLTIGNWWKRDFTVPTDITVPLTANFANQLYFLGYDLPQPQVRAGEAFPLTLYWQAPPDKSPQADFIQFNNLLDSNGVLHGGYDRHPLEYYNTLLWAPGEVVVDGYAVPVEADAPPGEYYLDVGYYLTVGESAVNLPLVIDGQMSEVSSVTIGPIEVVGR